MGYITHSCGCRHCLSVILLPLLLPGECLPLFLLIFILESELSACTGLCWRWMPKHSIW